VAALRAQAGGSLCVLAALDLLVGHGFWLRDEPFVCRFVEVWAWDVDGTWRARVDWQGAAEASQESWRLLRCSDAQGQVLRIAASLAEGVPVDLCDALSGLDERDLALVAGAVLHAGGYGAGLGAAAVSPDLRVGGGSAR
jgi:hypothetical protein